jgi:hypothetical protein
MATDELLLFAVPAFVLVDKGTREGCLHAEPLPLAELDAGTLAVLCDRFRAGVFARAAQTDPATVRAGAITTTAPELLEPLTDAELEALRRLDTALGSLIVDRPAGVVCAALALRLARELAAAVETTEADREAAVRVTGELLRGASNGTGAGWRSDRICSVSSARNTGAVTGGESEAAPQELRRDRRHVSHESERPSASENPRRRMPRCGRLYVEGS